ncbi:MAG: hypothetical protein H6677_16970 [Candidatus Obscuribacterales bacterium]|nr:hypothetical protein [Candidatus Obscuribacterales bacterium]
MSKIEQKYLEKLRTSGLHVSHTIPAFNDGVWVGKPVTTRGNSIQGYEPGYIVIGDDPLPPKMDAPMLKFHKTKTETWMVRGDDYVGGPGPGDFNNEWNTPEEAIEDILDFYFGDPARMRAKAEGRNQVFKPMEK